MQNGDCGASTLMKIDGFWGRFLVPSGVLRIVANSGSSFLVFPCGLMAVRVLVSLPRLVDVAPATSV